jgi:hypothetical protein
MSSTFYLDKSILFRCTFTFNKEREKLIFEIDPKIDPLIQEIRNVLKMDPGPYCCPCPLLLQTH